METQQSSDNPGMITRCVCMDVSFAQMKEYASAHGASLETLQQRFSCGRGCALCVPYVRAMLETGRSEFRVDEPVQGL